MSEKNGDVLALDLGGSKLALALVQHLAGWALGREHPDAGWLVTLTMSQGWFAGSLYDGLPHRGAAIR